MSDFGFDSYALDGEDAEGHPHPLEIARDLIAAGKPRSALEVMSLSHDQLVDDPDYLLLCFEAWRAVGDTLRAQQALLGAVRLSPRDPRPLELLAELVGERGESDRAERLLARARALDASTEAAEGSLDSSVPEQEEDDLIAFAERQERSQRASLRPSAIVIGVAVIGFAALVIGGIALVTEPSGDEASSPDPSTARTPPPEVDSAPSRTVDDPPSREALAPTSAPEAEPEAAPQSEVVAVVTAPEPVAFVEATEALPKPAASPSAPRSKPKLKAKPGSKPRQRARAVRPPPRQAATPPREPEPDPAIVRNDLASMTPHQLTDRADAHYARGHTAVAATYYRRALELDSDYAPALVGIGRSLLRAEKHGEAMTNATRALQLARGIDARPGLEAEAIYQIARVHLHRGELDAARRLLRQSVSLPGPPAAAWFYLGEALWSDNSPAAREAYEKYLELVPKGPLAVRARRAIQ